MSIIDLIKSVLGVEPYHIRSEIVEFSMTESKKTDYAILSVKIQGSKEMLFELERRLKISTYELLSECSRDRLPEPVGVTGKSS